MIDTVEKLHNMVNETYRVAYQAARESIEDGHEDATLEHVRDLLLEAGVALTNRDLYE